MTAKDPTYLRVPTSVLVLLSGGLDSTTLLSSLCQQRELGFTKEIQTISFDYGQQHAQAEIGQASMIAEVLDVPHEVLHLPGIFTRSPLVNPSALHPIPTGEDPHREVIAPTYVPRRNTVFLAVAAAIAEQRDLRAISFAAHKTDSAYPDCTEVFVGSFNLMLAVGSPPEHYVAMFAPLIRMTKTEIVRLAANLGAPVALTHSCYQGLQPACGVCDTCQLRIQAFQEADLIDPIEYAIDINWEAAWPFPGQS